MYMLRFASRKTIVLTDRHLVKELMDKRHAVSGDRPPAVILRTMLYDDDEMLLMQPSDARWRTGRKFLHQNFMASMIEKTHMPLINAEATQLIRDFLLEPEQFMNHSKRFGNSFIMSVGTVPPFPVFSGAKVAYTFSQVMAFARQRSRPNIWYRSRMS